MEGGYVFAFLETAPEAALLGTAASNLACAGKEES
jgi:hypothetical protein